MTRSEKLNVAASLGVRASRPDYLIRTQGAPKSRDCFILWYQAYVLRRARLKLRRAEEKRQAKLDRDRQYRAENREKIRERNKAYRATETSRERYREWENQYRQKPEVRIKKALRRRLQNAVDCQHTSRRFRTWDGIGCSPAFLRQYLESQFKRGMSWENYGSKWEIDHIIPISKFNLVDPEEQKRANHFTNLRPLRKEQNQEKKDQLINPQMGLPLLAMA